MQPVFDQAEQLLHTLIFGGGKPAPWLHDWSAHTIDYSWPGAATNIAAGQWATLLNTTGKGWLTFLRAMGKDGWNETEGPPIRITVDGGTPITWTADNAYALWGTDILVPIRFEVSLLVEVRNKDGSTRSFTLDHTILRDNQKPDVSKQTMLLHPTRREFAHGINGTTMTTVLDVLGSGWLVSLHTRGWGSGSAGTLEINGATVYSERRLDRTGPFMGPIRFETRLTVKHRSLSTTSDTWTYTDGLILFD